MNNQTPKMPQKSSKKPKSAPKYITERIKIEKLIPGGQALGTLADGKKIFLWGALPGEIVTKAQITKEKSTFIEGIALEIEQSSDKRIEPRDACYLSTSPWQIMDYDYELSWKKAILEEIFRQQKLQLNNCKISEVQTDGRDYFYRNKMEYALYYSHEDELIHLAFHGRGSHRKVVVESSSLERPEIYARAQEIIKELNAKHAEARNFQSLLLRCDQSGHVEGGLFENHQPRPKFPNLEDQILGQQYSYSPNGFFQINLPVYEMALREIKNWVNTAEVLDLYAGVGTIGLSVARDKNLTLVECDKSAYREMQHNCEGTGAKAILARSESALEYIQPAQTVILDPPRAGCATELIERLHEVEPPVIIYLSCNPITQARDLKMLESKYRIQKVVPYNFFPRTPHLENLVILHHI